MRFAQMILSLLLVAPILGGCNLPDLPREPADLPQMPDVLRDLGIPDLNEIPNLGSIAELPLPDAGPNAIAFGGPTERSIQVGEHIPGTDIELVSIGDNGAEFRVAGLRSNRTLADSLDYDGPWVGIDGVDYTLRLRIYFIGSDSVRAAGVQRVVVQNIQPVQQPVTLEGNTLALPYAGSATRGETLKGLTFGYTGPAEQGAQVSGLPADTYPYRKVGDSLQWEGLLRPDIPVEYDLRVILYNDNTLQVGGIATLQLPVQ